MRVLHQVYHGVMAGLALAVVWMVTVPDEPWVHQVNLAIWAVFFVDYAVRLALARDRRAFVRDNIPDLIAILPLDLLSNDEVFALGRAFRLARFVRLFRLLRAAAVLRRPLAHALEIMQTNGLGQVLIVAVTVVILGGMGIWLVEPEIGSPGDGIWWSIVTSTTVGYGDIAPKTLSGRLIAGVLMLVGIGSIGMFTGTLATYFIRRRRTANPHIDYIVSQLERWEDLSPEERRQLAAMFRALADGQTPNEDPHPSPLPEGEG